MSRPRSRRTPRLGLPADAVAAACAVWAGLALFCVFSVRGAREYERLAVLMKYQDDAVLKALFMAHKVCGLFDRGWRRRGCRMFLEAACNGAAAWRAPRVPCIVRAARGHFRPPPSLVALLNGVAQSRL